jgi:hypothetical protein
MPAAQAPRWFIEGFTGKVYYRHRRAEGSVRCSDWLGGGGAPYIATNERGCYVERGRVEQAASEVVTTRGVTPTAMTKHGLATEVVAGHNLRTCD